MHKNDCLARHHVIACLTHPVLVRIDGRPHQELTSTMHVSKGRIGALIWFESFMLCLVAVLKVTEGKSDQLLSMIKDTSKVPLALSNRESIGTITDGGSGIPKVC